MKKIQRILSICLTVCLLVVLCPAVIQAAEHPFSDVAPDAWYQEAVQYVYDNGLMSGSNDTSFEPEGQLTRAMFVTVLGRMEGVDTEQYADSGFSDVPDREWYSAYVAWAVEAGITSGYDEDHFGPHDNITREQMAAMVNRYLDDTGISFAEDSSTQLFKDRNDISSWARDGAETVRRAGLMVGDKGGRFNPFANTTRAEAASVFMRLHQSLHAFEQLVGVYEGWYIANQGETALTLIVYKDGEGYHGIFNFYNLPGHDNAEEGSYTMNISQTEDGFRFDADKWIEKPSTYILLDLEGTLDGDTLSGPSPTEFSVERVSDTPPDMSEVIGTYEGTYKASSVTRRLMLDIFEQDDIMQATFSFANMPDSSNSVEGSYEMRVYPLMDDGYGFLAGNWIDRPSGFYTIDLAGKLEGDTLSGTEPTEFTVTRTSSAPPETKTVDIYAGPGEDYTSLGSVSADEIDSYCLEDGSWIEVEYGGNRAYVREDDLDDLDKTELPYVSRSVISGPTQRPYIVFFDDLEYTLTCSVDIYSGPDEDSAQVVTLSENDTVFVLHEMEGENAVSQINPFILIEYEGTDGKARGYVRKNSLLDINNPLRGFDEVKQSNASFTHNGKTYYSTAGRPSQSDGWATDFSDSLTQVRFNWLSALTGAIASNEGGDTLKNETWMYDAKSGGNVAADVSTPAANRVGAASDLLGMVNAALAAGNDSIALQVDLESCEGEGRMLVRGGTPFESPLAGKTISLASLIAKGGALDTVTSGDQADELIRKLYPGISGSEKCSMTMTFSSDYEENPYGYSYVIGRDGSVYAQLILHNGTRFEVYQGGEYVGDIAPYLSGMLIEVNDETASRILEVLSEYGFEKQ